MICTGCGAEANAACNCGVPYVTKAFRAAEALKVNPEKSNRLIAEEIGVDEKQVRREREKLGADMSAPVEMVIGKDGKSYPATSPPRGTFGSGEVEWYTPAEYIEAARQTLGTIDLDPASSEIAQQTVKANEFFTKDDDGLSKPWRGRVWLNPPYAQPHVTDFIFKLIKEFQNGKVSDAILLTNNYTDTGWFHESAKYASAICFTRGRIKFNSPTRDVAAPIQGQAFFLFGKNIGKFLVAFQSLGFVVGPIK
jgi:ParB family chromosome partitioning protein